ncbi:MAG TPA: hypothetical protein PJ982_05645, partial [Lacipirellulaceae bacterium]|nr:hypothetical protein [Lacipirellulaceae bacterium]
QMLAIARCLMGEPRLVMFDEPSLGLAPALVAQVFETLRSLNAQGLSILLFTDLDDYLTVDLPVPLPTKIYFGVPQLKHLLAALDHYKKYLVVLFSEVDKKLIEVFLTSPTDDAVVRLGTEGGLSLRPGGRTARTQASGRRDLDSARRLAADAAAEVADCLLGDPEIERVVFGGNLKLAHAVKHQLHPSVADAVVAIERIDFNASNNDVAAAVKRLAAEHELEHDLGVVSDLIDRRHACGTAVLERQGVQLAVEQGQAQSIVLSLPIAAEEFDPLLVKAVLNNVDFEFLHGEAAERLNQFGGVAAKLYYSGR